MKRLLGGPKQKNRGAARLADGQQPSASARGGADVTARARAAGGGSERDLKVAQTTSERLAQARQGRGGLMQRLLRRQTAKHRSDARYSCHVSASLKLLEDDVDIHGDLLDVSPGGAMFRPSSRFLLYRHRDLVTISTETVEIRAVIMNSSPRGYGIRFLDRLNTEMFRTLLGASRDKPVRMDR